MFSQRFPAIQKSQPRHGGKHGLPHQFPVQTFARLQENLQIARLVAGKVGPHRRRSHVRIQNHGVTAMLLGQPRSKSGGQQPGSHAAVHAVHHDHASAPPLDDGIQTQQRAQRLKQLFGGNRRNEIFAHPHGAQPPVETDIIFASQSHDHRISRAACADFPCEALRIGLPDQIENDGPQTGEVSGTESLQKGGSSFDFRLHFHKKSIGFQKVFKRHRSARIPQEKSDPNAVVVVHYPLKMHGNLCV